MLAVVLGGCSGDAPESEATASGVPPGSSGGAAASPVPVTPSDAPPAPLPSTQMPNTEAPRSDTPLSPSAPGTTPPADDGAPEPSTPAEPSTPTETPPEPDPQPEAGPDLDPLIGFATLNGGTRGGQGGEVVTASTFAELKSFAESAEPYIIRVEGTLTNGPAGGVVNVQSNKSIVGVGSTAFLSGVGLHIDDNDNVIIQNLRLTLLGTTTPSSVNGGDVIAISGTSRNIWIDHVELFSEDPNVQTDIDKYDGLIDIRDQTGFITVSWSFFHDHHKGGLVGASDTDLFADRRITFHHNHYENVHLRIPMYRGSTGHFFNNYVVGATDATEIRAGTCVRVEKNFYEALHFSIYTPSDQPGSAERIDNIEAGRTPRAYPASCVADIPYPYADALTNDTNDVKTLVPQQAGVGKL